MKILMVCGGTGGHIYPALAIAEAFKQISQSEIIFAGRQNSMEEKLVQPSFPLLPILAIPLRRHSVLKNLGLPWGLLRALWRAWKVIDHAKPDFVVATGGYVSLPIVVVAGIKGLPVYLQEQNAVAGIANRIGARFARKIFVTSEAASRHFGLEKCSVMGNPVRTLPKPEQISFPPHYQKDLKTVLILGGSQGAQGINQKLQESLDTIGQRSDIQVFWQAGSRNVEQIRQSVTIPQNVFLLGFIDDVYRYICAADVVVSRAGASTLAELLAFGKAMILFPYPYATANHQEHNARVVEKEGAAWVELDREPNNLWNKVISILDDSEKKKQMESASLKMGMPDAAARIAQKILEDFENDSK